MKRDFPCGPVAKTHAPDAGGSSLVPGQETRFHTQELKIQVPQSLVAQLVKNLPVMRRPGFIPG